MNPELLPEHTWLQQLVGEWEAVIEGCGGPDQPATTHTAAQTVRSLTVWVQCEGTMALPDGSPAHTVLTLGYDPAKKKFVGTFIASMMTNLWTYEGELDPAGKVLTLDAEGPSMIDPHKTARYKDAIEILSPDHHTLTSRYLGDDGRWHQFMTAHYRRKR